MTIPSEPNTLRRAVVIGGGFGGLATAIRLQGRGVQVTLVEKRAKLGGRAYQHKEAGYTFDMGPSLITAPDILDDLFQAGGRRFRDAVDLMELAPYYRVYFHDGSHIDYSGDAEAMKRQMAAFHPGDAANYDAFMEAIRPIYEAVIQDRLGAQPFDTPGSLAAFVPRAVKMRALGSVTRFVNRYFRDERHRFLFSFHPLFIGGNPFRSPSIYLSIPYLERAGGVWFTQGGMYTVVEAMERLFRELGGRIETGCEVRHIRVEGGRATGVETDRGTFAADAVISNGDVARTYRDLVAPEHRKRWSDRRLDKLDLSMSCYVLYLGTRKQYPKLKHHTLILSDRYKELLRDIFDKKILPEDFSMYLHAPTRTDPGMAPDGCDSLYVLVPVANLESGMDWNELREPFGDRIIEFLEQWGMPGLRESIEVRKAFTPLEFRDELNAAAGNAFAIEPKLTQTAYFRPHNRSEDVAGLYMVGAGTHPGAGVPGVLLSAECTERCIVDDYAMPAAPPLETRAEVA